MKITQIDNFFIAREKSDKLQSAPDGLVAFDSETHTYFKNKKISSQKELDNLFINKKIIRDEYFNNFEVKPWCYQIYDDLNGLFCTNSVELLIKYLEDIKASVIWCFNLKFDGRALLFDLIKRSKLKIIEEGTKEKEFDYCLSYCVDQQKFYCLKFYNKKNRFTILDFSNIIATSIDGLAKMFNLDVQKTTMDYFAVEFEDLKDPKNWEYVRNDCVILYRSVKLLAQEIEDTYPELKINLYGNCKHYYTAGSIAKTFLLHTIYKTPNNVKKKIEKYNLMHPNHSSEKSDNYYRKVHLYRGGITCVNKDYIGWPINKKIFAYDVNSEYPAAMLEAHDLIGKCKVSKELLPSDKYVKIIIFKRLHFKVLPHAFPFFYYDGDYHDEFEINEPFALFEEEYEELKKFYEIDGDILIYHYYQYKKDLYIYKKYVEKFYELKLNSKDNPPRRQFVKILLNSAYGKLGQKIERDEIKLKIDDKFVTFKPTKNTLIDEDAGMSIVNASYITMRARCIIMRYLMEIGKGNPRKNIIYMDTDSCYSFEEYNKCSDKLGDMKLERIAEKGIFLAPKTYALFVDNKKMIKTKGLSKFELKKVLDNLSWEEFLKKFDYDNDFFVKSSTIIKGGTFIFKRWKTLAKGVS